MARKIVETTPDGVEQALREERRAFRATATALIGVPSKAPAVLPGRQVDPWMHPFGASQYTPRQAGRDRETLTALRIARDFDPQASQAVWNFQRLMNPGLDLKAYLPQPDGSMLPESGPAQQALDALAARVGAEYGGGLDNLHDTLSLVLLTQGAVAAEVAPTTDGRDIEDWYPVDPLLLTYKRMEVAGEFFADGAPKTDLKLGQIDYRGIWNELPMGQVFYAPLDSDIDDPYGRAPFVSMLQQVVAKAAMLTDLKSFVHNQGYPRIDVKVLWEELLKRAPNDLLERGDETALAQWASTQLTAIATDYQGLHVDDTFVHYDFVEIGPMNAGNATFDATALDKILTDQLSSALKMLPIMTATGAGTGAEVHGGVQWNIMALSVGTLRRHVKRVIEKMANCSLQILGLSAKATIEYDDLRTTDRLYEAQAEMLEGKSLQTDVQQHWRTNDEAAEIRTGHAVPPEFTDPEDHVGGPVVGPAAGPGVGKVGPGAPVGEITPGSGQESNIASQQPHWSAAWDKLLLEDQPPLGTRRAVAQRSAVTPVHVAKYRRQAGLLFMGQKTATIDALVGAGLLDRTPALSQRDTGPTIADDVFGLGYRREMKGLLRNAVQEGAALAGVDDLSGLETIVNRIWSDNTGFVTSLRDDLAEAIDSGQLTTLDDVAAWFVENAYRSDMMGDFLGKQGLNSGYANGVDQQSPQAQFEWQMGDVKTEHCDDCLSRDGQTYTSDELDSIGYPGSDALECMSNCQCTLVAVQPAPDVSTTMVPAKARRHFAGQHDQETHGNWDHGPSADEDSVSFHESFHDATFASPSQQDAVLHYANDFIVNEHLRDAVGEVGQLSPTEQDQVKEMDAAIAAHKTETPITVFRGANPSDFSDQIGPNEKDWVGQWVSDNGYLSTSGSQSVAEGFGRGLLLEINVPSGCPALSFSDQLQEQPRFPSESEVLFPRDTAMTIDSVDHNDYGDIVVHASMHADQF